MKYRPEIDGLRAIAVIPVVLFHAGIAGFGGGFIGVDVFFVISGFLITSIILRELGEGRFSFVGFWERRARRIMPALLTVILFTMVAAWFVLTPGDLNLFGRSVLAQSLFASNVFFWQEAGYFGPAAEEIPLLHTWSLAVEEQFYLLFPVSFVLVTRYAFRLRWGLVLGVSAVSLLLSVWATDQYPTAAFYLLPTRAWELGLGALLAIWAQKADGTHRNRGITEFAGLAGLGLIIYAVLAFDNSTEFPGVNALYPVIGTGLIIWSQTGRLTIVGRILSIRPLVAIGLISYSLYLWHWPLLVLTSYPDGTGPEGLDDRVKAGVILFSVVLAYGSWRFIETPFRRRSFLAARPTLIASAVSALFVTGILGAVFGTGSIPSAFRSEEADAYAAADHRSPRQRACISDNRDINELADLCRHGSTDGTPKFLVWGDSHGEALLPMFDLLSDEHGIKGVHASLSTCPPILGIHVEFQPRCEEFNSVVIQLIRDSGIRHVVLVGYWDVYRTPGHEYVERSFPLIPDDFGMGQDQDEVFEASLAHTVSTLIKEGFEVWLVNDVPRFGFDPPRRISVAARRGQDVSSFGISEADYRAQASDNDRLFQQLAAADGARIINPADVLCSEEYCPLVQGGKLLFRDGDHLSIDGAHFIKEAFSEFAGSIDD